MIPRARGSAPLAAEATSATRNTDALLVLADGSMRFDTASREEMSSVLSGADGSASPNAELSADAYDVLCVGVADAVCNSVEACGV